MNRELRGLYVILDPDIAPERDLVELAMASMDGGAKLLQLRAKHAEKGEVLPVAQAIASLARERGVTFVINDHADLALAAGADGVHVGQRDLPVAFLRQLLGPDAVIGCSAATPEEAKAAEQAGASYLGTGAIYPTSSKDRTRPTGLDGLRRVIAATSLPVFGIGGVTAENVGPIIETGAVGAAVISAVIRADDVREAARALHEAIEATRREQSGAADSNA